ncbi:MAG: carboxypeptidase-like regulatory domain-containing protein [Longimicrobiales bacterium]|nr:carboxypeptidase-like regulatory domain-containing protein [Longimicrobiales bacterium]
MCTAARATPFGYMVLSLVLTAPSASAQQVVIVEVREAGTGRAVPDARLDVVDVPEIGIGFALTDASGRATLRGIDAGEWTLEVTTRGYVSREVRIEVLPDAPTFVRVELTATPIALDSIAVSVEGLDPLLVHHGFYERSKSNRGYYYDPRRLTRIAGGTRISSQLRYMRRVRVMPPYPNPSIWVGRIGRCRPDIWVDGMRLRGIHVDSVVNPDDVIGVEIYDQADLVPIPFRTGEGPNCAILIWTRRN